jgi:colicin import membrane protein
MTTDTKEGQDVMLTENESTNEKKSGTDIVLQVSEDPGLVLLDRERFNQFYEAVKEETDKLVPDLTTEKGRSAIASMAFKVTKTKTAIDAAGKLLKEEAQKTVQTVDAARREIRLKLEALAEEVRKPLTEWEQAEEARFANCKAIIHHIEECGRGFIAGAPQAYAVLLHELEERIVIDDTFREFEPAARQALAVALERIRDGAERERKAEADRLELERLRAEAAARAAKERAEAEAKAAAEHAERVRIQAEQKAKADAEAEQARIEAAAKAAEVAARQEAERKANEERLAAERAHAEALAAERRRSDALEASQRAEVERQRLEREAAEKRASDIEHRSLIMGAAKKAIMALGVDEDVARSIVLAIKADEIPNVSIRF